MSKRLTIIISFTILLLAGGVLTIIFLTEPEAQREGATIETAMLVDVMKAEKGNFRPMIMATGTVQPSKDIMLSPRVSGEIIDRSDAFVPGGYVQKGEILLQIDPADYRNILALRESELQQALADLSIEEGRQTVARKDLEMLEGTLPVENESLVLREPQLNAIRARVAAARAAVEQAELDLQRTTLRAPFDANILTRDVNIGSQVSPGETLGRLVGDEEYWVVTTVPLPTLRWIRFQAREGEKGSKVRIRSRTAWGEEEYRTGYVSHLIGALEEQTRLARVIVSVPDPLSHRSESDGKPPLVIGAFVEVIIEGEEIPGVVRISRDFTRQNNTIWVKKADSLVIREINILFQDSEYAYIEEGLDQGDEVVTTNLSTVTQGARLRVEGEATASGGEEEMNERTAVNP